jgi:hypothetical protein
VANGDRCVKAISPRADYLGKVSIQFQKRGQLSIRAHNKAISVVAVRVSNPDRLPVGINGRDTAPTPTGFAEIVSDDFPLLHSILPLAGPTC